jgi:molybdopterin-guanine dinucleotide biosynthesis protein B
MTPVDLLIIEGYKHHSHAKLEVFRREVGKALLAPDDPRIFAVASDGPVPEAGVPVIALHDAVAIADAILGHLGLRGGAPAVTLAR